MLKGTSIVGYIAVTDMERAPDLHIMGKKCQTVFTSLRSL